MYVLMEEGTDKGVGFFEKSSDWDVNSSSLSFFDLGFGIVFWQLSFIIICLFLSEEFPTGGTIQNEKQKEKVGKWHLVTALSTWLHLLG